MKYSSLFQLRICVRLNYILEFLEQVVERGARCRVGVAGEIVQRWVDADQRGSYRS